jgi:hydroxyacylglutathione hydrolase
VDASFEPEPMIEFVRSSGMTPQALILTHTHVDHIAGVRTVLAAFPGLPLLVHPAEEKWLWDPMLNLSAMSGLPVTTPEPTGLMNEGDELVLGDTTWRVLHTPGHSPGGITLYHANSGTAIVGDSLFSGSIGRTDLPGGDHATLERSIKQKLYTLPEHVRVYPGHGPDTTIGRERRSNPYVRG